MKLKNIITLGLSPIVCVLFFINNSAASESVEWTIYKKLQLEEAAVDVAISPDERRLFVLTEQGVILIYSSPTKIEAQIDVSGHVDQMKIGPRGDTLILNSRKNKTVQLIMLDFIKNINVSGSPFKGPEDAPVVIAIFSDFE